MDIGTDRILNTPNLAVFSFRNVPKEIIQILATTIVGQALKNFQRTLFFKYFPKKYFLLVNIVGDNYHKYVKVLVIPSLEEKPKTQQFGFPDIFEF